MAKTTIATKNAEKAEKAPELTSRSLRRRWPAYMAAGFSIAWTAVAVILLGLAQRKGWIGSIDAVDIGVFIGALFTPVVTFWMMALVFQRTDPLLERRLAMARTLAQTLSPIDTAEQRLDSLLTRLSRDLQTLNHTTDLAGERITALEDRFKEQLSELFSATADAENRAVHIRDVLQQERTAIEGLSRALEQQGKDLHTGLEAVKTSAQDIQTSTTETVRSAAEHIRRETAFLDQTVQHSSQQLGEALTTISERDTQLRTNAEQIFDILQKQIKSLDHSQEEYQASMEKLGSAVHDMHEIMTEDAQALTSIAETASNRSDFVRETLIGHAEALAGAADKAVTQTLGAAESFKDQAFEVEKRAQNTVDMMSNAATALNTQMDESVNRLERETTGLNERLSVNVAQINEQMASLHTQVTEKLNQLRGDIEKSITHGHEEMRSAMAQVGAAMTQNRAMLQAVTDEVKETTQGLNTASYDAQTILENSIQSLSHKTNDLTQNINATNDRIAGIESRIHEQQSALQTLLDTLGGNFNTAIAQLNTQGEALQRIGSDHQMSLESHVATLEEQLEHLQTILHNAVNQVAETGTLFKETAGEITNASEEQSERLDISLQRLTSQRVQVMDELERLASELTSSCDAATRKLTALNLEKGDISQGLSELSETLDKQLSKVRETVRTMNENAQDGAVQVGAAYLTAMSRSRKVALDAVEVARNASNEVARTIEETIFQAISRISENEDIQVATLENRMQDSAAKITSLLHKTLEDVAVAASQTGTLIEQTSQRLSTETSTLVKHSDELGQRLSLIERRLGEQSKSDLVHNSSLIIEGLNSAAIDINRALSTEVPDDVWSSYLAGDKSIFARRTVKIADRQTRSVIAKRYDNDGEFRDNVRTYLKDFELLMARAMAGSEPSALSITLVSSELGKLYVLLAQSIKRMN